VELWRVDIPTVHGLPLLVLTGLHWQTTVGMQQWESWCCAHFDALQLFGVLPHNEGCASVESLAVLAASAPSVSLLPELKTAQQHDPFLWQVAKGVDGSDHGVWRDFFRNEQGFLCYLREGDAVPRICVPKLSRDAVLHAAHGGALVGHLGITCTAANIAQFFWWPNLFRDVAHFVRSCRTCATAKGSTGLRLGVDSFSSVPLQLFTHWSMDLIGPLPKSRSGNDLIVTWVDRTSKLIVAKALRQGNSSAKVLAELTFEAICCRFGLPARLTHDNDVRFQSLWKELWRLLNTKISCTSAYMRGPGGARSRPCGAAQRSCAGSGPLPRAGSQLPVDCVLLLGGVAGAAAAGLRRMPRGRWGPAIGGRPHRRPPRRRVSPGPFFLADCDGL
jgi:hypothetical protein